MQYVRSANVSIPFLRCAHNSCHCYLSHQLPQGYRSSPLKDCQHTTFPSSMVNYRVFLGAVLLITCFNLVLFLNQRKGHVLSNETFHSPSFWLNPVYTLLHQLKDDRLFVLEPHVLAQVLDSGQLTNLKWRFNLSEFKYDRNCLTLAMFGPEMVCFRAQTLNK